MRRSLPAAIAGLALVAGVLAACSSSAAPGAAQHYVALGDSYAAGILTGLSGYRPAGCLQSDKDYPHDVQAVLRAASFVDVSCDGASTDDMSSPQQVPGGRNPPQLDAVTRKDTLVTVTIGGNDIGFLSIIEHCASLVPTGTPCRDHYTSGGGDQLALRIAQTAPKVADVLTQVRRRAPGARVLLVGYPDLLPATGGCWPDVPFTDGDAAYLRTVELGLNAMLATQAAAHGATYVDTYTPSVGHDMCRPSDVRWVEPLIPTSFAAPFHPNATGEQHMADAVLGALHATR